MDLSIDHVVIVVNDLTSAIENYASLGFTVVPSGEHAGGLTHNALIAFSDGTYIELIAFKGNAPPDHLFARAVDWGGGLVTYALLPANIEQTIAQARQRGLQIEGPIPGGRMRPDGQEIAWQTGRPSTFDLPFLCADVTPRDKRVPDGEARKHANGAMGIDRITILVSNYSASMDRYQALLGEEVPIAITQFAAEFQVGEATITFVQPIPQSSSLSNDHMREYFKERGEVPYSLTLRAAAGASTGLLDTTLTGGALIEVTHQAALKNKEQD